MQDECILRLNPDPESPLQVLYPTSRHGYVEVEACTVRNFSGQPRLSPLLPEGPILISNGLNDFDANSTARQFRSLTRRSKVASIFLFIAQFVGFPVSGSEFIRPSLFRNEIRILIKLQLSTFMTKPILLNK